MKLSRYYEEFMQATPSETYLLPSSQNLCPITGEEDCTERSCELHYTLAPLRIAPELQRVIVDPGEETVYRALEWEMDHPKQSYLD